MKQVLGILALSISINATAGTLVCVELWKNNQEKEQVLRSEIFENGDLGNFEFSGIAVDGYHLPPQMNVRVQGRINSKANSPYKGSVDYNLDDSLRLILPKSLEASALEQSKVGKKGNENGVLVIGAKHHGSHDSNFPLRMRCRSY